MSVYVVLLWLSIVKLSEITSYRVPAAPAFSEQPKLLPPTKKKFKLNCHRYSDKREGPSRSVVNKLHSRVSSQYQLKAKI